MHELSIVIELVRIVEAEAEKQKAEAVEAIVLQIGELSATIPRYVEDCFPAVIIDKPMFEQTKLEIEILPGIAKCRDCGKEFNVIETKGYCPSCNSFDKDLLQGREFVIKEIRIPAEADR